MRIVVLGAGVVGVTTAYALAKDGHEVTVVEREEAAALGTSFGNASQISPALSAPWSTPGLAGKALKWMMTQYPPLIIGRIPDWTMASWLWRMWRQATPERYAYSKEAMVRLGEYSRDQMRLLRTEEPFDYNGRQLGTFVLFRKEEQVKAYQTDIDTLQRMNVPGRFLTLSELAAMEPNINQEGLAGAVHLPGDETGDCHRFTQGLAHAAQTKGVLFLYNTSVKQLRHAGNKVTGVDLGSEILDADLVVCTLGVASRTLLAPFGLKLPIYPLKGYSMTIQTDSDRYGPVSTIAEETYKIGITNLGDRIRVGGTAELVGYDLSRPEHRYEGLRFVAKKLFPQIPDSDLAAASCWSGLRPMTPDGPPMIGAAVFDNLIVNSGHGTLGWTMACGSAQVVADMVAQRKPAVAVEAFSPLRYR